VGHFDPVEIHQKSKKKKKKRRKNDDFFNSYVSVFIQSYFCHVGGARMGIINQTSSMTFWIIL
jgi:hypothetical protein